MLEELYNCTLDGTPVASVKAEPAADGGLQPGTQCAGTQRPGKARGPGRTEGGSQPRRSAACRKRGFGEGASQPERGRKRPHTPVLQTPALAGSALAALRSAAADPLDHLPLVCAVSPPRVDPPHRAPPAGSPGRLRETVLVSEDSDDDALPPPPPSPGWPAGGCLCNSPLAAVVATATPA
eukprot:EG_transcript_32374